MAIIPAQIAIANLIDSAQKGEIDPWNVPVIEVIDRVLQELGLLETTELSATQADLPQSGQAFLWASMLVLLKADTLQMLQEIEREEAVENESEELTEDDTEETTRFTAFFRKSFASSYFRHSQRKTQSNFTRVDRTTRTNCSRN